MSIETSVTDPDDLNPSWPDDGDPKSQGARQMRQMKTAIIEAYSRTKKTTFVTDAPFDAPADGSSDDSTAFAAALAASTTVYLEPGKTYVVGDVAIPENTQLYLNNAIVKKKAGANHIFTMSAYKASLVNGELQGLGTWVSTTISAASVGATSVVVVSATGLEAGMRCFFQSDWEDGEIESFDIGSIVGTTVNLLGTLRGNVTAGAKFAADHALLKVSGSGNYAGTVKDLFVRNMLVGIQSGENAAAGSASFTSFDNILFEDYVGAALAISANSAAEDFTTIRGNGGKTQVANYIGNGATVRFAIPYSIAKKVYRWGGEPSVRLLVNGSQLTTAQYTVDLATMEVVANVAPASLAAVQVQNYEYSAFGVIGQNSVPLLSASSVERMTGVLMLSANVGIFLDNCQLGFLNQVQADTCGYCTTLIYGQGDIHLRTTDHLFSPHGLIIHSDVTNVSVTGINTGYIPDADEFVPTVGKTEIIVRAGAQNILIDYTSWASKTDYSCDIHPLTRAFAAPVYLTPDGLAIGGDPSGKAILYCNDDRYYQVDDDGDLFLGGGTGGVRKFHSVALNDVMQIGAPNAGGRVQLISGNGSVNFELDENGRIRVTLPTSSAGLPSGTLWSDAGTLKVT